MCVCERDVMKVAYFNSLLCVCVRERERGIARVLGKGGAKYYARKIFDHAPSLNVKVKIHNELESAF